jgi:hypothetical protein
MWIMVKRKLTVGGLISHLASVVYYHDCICFKPSLAEKNEIFFVCPTCNLYMEYHSRFSVAPFQETREVLRQPGNLHFPNKTIQRCAQFPDNSVYDCR